MRDFNDANEALCYMVECTMATLEYIRDVKRTPKHEITRQESIVSSGVGACRKLKLLDVANRTGCPRLAQVLSYD